LPLLLVSGCILWFAEHDVAKLLLLLPGIIVLPLFSLVPAVLGQGIPLSAPPEEAKSVGRGLNFLWVMLVSMALSGISLWAWNAGWFWPLVLGETVLSAALYVALRISLTKLRWPPME
jgi:hypothetical protein